MLPAPTIRPAFAADAEALIAHKLKPRAEPDDNSTPLDPDQPMRSVEQQRQLLQRAVDRHDDLFLVAELDGRIIGCAEIVRSTHPSARHVSRIAVDIDAAYRRQGIGTSLMLALLDWAKCHGLRRIQLSVFARNTPAIALYHKLGFVEEGVHRMAFLKQGQWIDEITMEMILPEAASR